MRLRPVENALLGSLEELASPADADRGSTIPEELASKGYSLNDHTDELQIDLPHLTANQLKAAVRRGWFSFFKAALLSAVLVPAAVLLPAQLGGGRRWFDKQQLTERSTCGAVLLPRGTGVSDIMSTGHLPPRSFEFKVGTPGETGYQHGYMQVAPGIHCSDQGIGFPLFGGVSRQEQYFEIRTIDGVPPFHNSFVDYPEQTMLEMRIFFDTGEPIRSRDYLVAGMPPAGAKRVVRVEMDFSTGGEGKVTLKWSE